MVILMSNKNNEQSIRLRGHRVPAIQPSYIEAIAKVLCNRLSIKKSSFTKNGIGRLINSLEEFRINIDPVEDDKWIDIAEAMVDPSTNMIRMSNRLYLELNNAQPNAIRIFLHELGHIFLAHRPNLHFSTHEATLFEDSEWQADTFADSIIELLGLPKESGQLELDLKVRNTLDIRQYK